MKSAEEWAKDWGVAIVELTAFQGETWKDEYFKRWSAFIEAIRQEQRKVCEEAFRENIVHIDAYNFECVSKAILNAGKPDDS